MDIGRINSAVESVWETERHRIMTAPMDESIRAVVIREVHSVIRNVENILQLENELQLQGLDDETRGDTDEATD